MTIEQVRKSEVEVENSKSYTNTFTLSDTTSRQIISIKNQINKEVLEQSSDFETYLSGDKAEQVFQNYVNLFNEVTRAFIETVYYFGAKYANLATKNIHFTTDQDIENIKNITRITVDGIKKIILRYYKREQDISIQDLNIEIYDKIVSSFYVVDNFELTKKEQQKQFKLVNPDYRILEKLSIDKHLVNLIDTIANLALNIGTLSKARQLFLVGQENSVISLAATPEEAFLVREELAPYAIWITKKDERVCPICKPLHQLIFRLDNLSIPIPPYNSHPNCRCRLFLFNINSGYVLLDVL